MFYQGGPIDHCTHVPGPVAQSSSESEYNTECTSGMDLAHLRMIKNKLTNKDTYVVTEHTPLIILDRKSADYTAKNGKDTKHTRHISKRMIFKETAKSEICNEGGLKLADIGTKNVREDKLNNRLGYAMVRLDK